jgi:transposase-like protein
MPIGPDNPFKGRQHPGELIILCVRLYLRYPLDVNETRRSTRAKNLPMFCSV